MTSAFSHRSAAAWARCASLLILLTASGCSDPQPAGNGPAAAGGAPGGGAAAPAGEPWVVLSDFQMDRGGLTNKAQVRYRFVQGGPQPGQQYYLFVEQSSGSSVEWVDEPVQLAGAEGTLTVEVDGRMGPGPICTFLATGQRSTEYGAPEPPHISAKLYLGQSESSSIPGAPEAAPAAAKLTICATLAKPRRESTPEGERIVIDYQMQQVPEAAGFWLLFVGAEGGSVSYDVNDTVRAAPQSGTLRVEVPDPTILEPPYEVTLEAQPFGAARGAAGDTEPISAVLRVE